MIDSQRNVRTEHDEIVLTGRLGQIRTSRSYIKAKQMEALAVEKVRKNWSDGITIMDLVTTGLARNKKQAQRMMKYYLHDKKILFTLARKCPQKYYPCCLKADILQRARKTIENVLTDHTEVNPSLISHLSDMATRDKTQ